MGTKPTLRCRRKVRLADVVLESRLVDLRLHHGLCGRLLAGETILECRLVCLATIELSRSPRELRLSRRLLREVSGLFGSDDLTFEVSDLRRRRLDVTDNTFETAL